MPKSGDGQVILLIRITVDGLLIITKETSRNQNKDEDDENG